MCSQQPGVESFQNFFQDIQKFNRWIIAKTFVLWRGMWKPSSGAEEGFLVMFWHANTSGNIEKGCTKYNAQHTMESKWGTRRSVPLLIITCELKWKSHHILQAIWHPPNHIFIHFFFMAWLVFTECEWRFWYSCFVLATIPNTYLLCQIKYWNPKTFRGILPWNCWQIM